MISTKSILQHYHPVSLLSVVSKIFEKLVNNKLVDHLEKCDLFFDFQYSFRSVDQLIELLGVLIGLADSRAVVLDILKTF